MPYASEAQRRWAHTPAGTKALGGKDKVLEWDNASTGLKLPDRIKKKIEKKATEDALNNFGIKEQYINFYHKKIADIAATNAIATFTGAKKPLLPAKPTGQSMGIKLPGFQQKAFNQNNQGSETVVNDALTQNSLASGSQKIDTGASLPITT